MLDLGVLDAQVAGGIQGLGVHVGQQAGVVDVGGFPAAHGGAGDGIGHVGAVGAVRLLVGAGGGAPEEVGVVEGPQPDVLDVVLVVALEALGGADHGAVILLGVVSALHAVVVQPQALLAGGEGQRLGQGLGVLAVPGHEGLDPAGAGLGVDAHDKHSARTGQDGAEGGHVGVGQVGLGGVAEPAEHLTGVDHGDQGVFVQGQQIQIHVAAAHHVIDEPQHFLVAGVHFLVAVVALSIHGGNAEGHAHVAVQGAVDPQVGVHGGGNHGLAVHGVAGGLDLLQRGHEGVLGLHVLLGDAQILHDLGVEHDGGVGAVHHVVHIGLGAQGIGHPVIHGVHVGGEEPPVAVGVGDGLLHILGEVLEQVGVGIILLQELRDGVHVAGLDQLRDGLGVGDGDQVGQVVGGDHQRQLGGSVGGGLLDGHGHAEVLLQRVQQGRGRHASPVGGAPAGYVRVPVDDHIVSQSALTEQRGEQERQNHGEGGKPFHVRVPPFIFF